MVILFPQCFLDKNVDIMFSISFLCCPILCLEAQSSVLWCRLRYPHKNDVRFVFNSSCLICVIWACLRIVVSNTYCVMFLLCFMFRLVYPRLPVFFLGCPFLIVLSVFNLLFTFIMHGIFCWHYHIHLISFSKAHLYD
jgi:hypothetical protein